MPPTEADRLRSLVGEVIPEGGSDTDTLFTADEITDLLTRHTTVADSLGEAWEIKAAKLSTLVDTREGDQQRNLSQAHKQALAMAEHYTLADGGGLVLGGGKTSISKIKRPGSFQG